MQSGAPQASLALATYLKEKTEVEPIIYDLAIELKIDQMSIESLINYFLNIPEEIIGISVWDSILPKVVLATKYLKESNRNKIIIIGGPSASSVGEKITRKYPWIDFAVKGEGEQTLVNVLDCISTTKVNPEYLSSNIVGNWKGEHIQGKGKILRLKSSEISALNYNTINHKAYHKYELSTSRGCPYHCEFCSANNVWEGKLRYKIKENIRKEIDFIYRNADHQIAHIIDDSFGVNQNQFEIIYTMFTKDYPNFGWTSYFRIDDLTEDKVIKLGMSGCKGVFIGLESGCDDKLIAMGKNVTNDLVLHRLKNATNYFHVTTSFIWGHPDESQYELNRTLSFISELLPIENLFVNLYQLAPLTGTKVYEQLLQTMIFDESTISGLIYPQYYPRLTQEEKELIKSSPEIFSAFYRHDSDLFLKKRSIIEKFIS